jgi:tetratricopeptide (TPR) repeat protein
MTGSTPGSTGRALHPEAAAALEDGLRRYREGDPEGAHEKFGQAHRRAPSDPRIQSWYGLTLVLVEKNSILGMVLVDEAVRNSRPDPELIINQAQVAMSLGQRIRAVRALERGLAMYPGRPELVAAREALGRRHRPVLPFLSRSNWMNRLLGRIHYRWTLRKAARGRPSMPDGEG